MAPLAVRRVVEVDIGDWRFSNRVRDCVAVSSVVECVASRARGSTSTVQRSVGG